MSPAESFTARTLPSASAMSSSSISAPGMSGQRFGERWSSRNTAATPASAKRRAVRAALTALP
jgi:hypothetical protein